VVDPYLVIFQWSNWYLLGFDDAETQFKLYKLNRICDLHATNTNFQLQEIPKEKLDFSSFFTEELQAVILFDKSEKYRLVEEYGIDSFTEMPEGNLRFSFAFTNHNYLLSWVLSFGENAELIEPKSLRPILQERLKKTIKKYF
jgi:predicted DNA-binding transcriptional regulator YafY